MPAAWSARPNPTVTVATSSDSARALPHQPAGAPLAHQLLILAVLEHRAQRRVSRLGRQAGGAEQLERRNPVDPLGDARRPLPVGRTPPLQRAGHVARQLTRGAWHASPPDLD